MLSRRNTVYLALFLAAMALPNLILAWQARGLICKGYPDFTIFYSAARMVRTGLGDRLYDEATQLRVQHEFVTGATTRQGPLPYNHPAFEALFFIPLTFLPYCAAFVIWDLINLGILLALPCLLRPHVPLLREIPPAGWLLASIAFFPIFVALLQGQDVLLQLLLLTLAFIALQKNRDWAAGCWLGLSLFRFHALLPLLLGLLWQRRTRAVYGFLCVAVVLAAVSVVTVGWRAAIAYPGYVLETEQLMVERTIIVPANMPNLRGLVALVPATGTAKRVEDVFAVALTVALILWAAAKWRRTPPAVFNLGFCLCVLATVVTAYHALTHDLSLLILVAVLVADYIVAKGASGARAMLLLAPVFVLSFTPLEVFLWFRKGHFAVIALVLLFWFWRIAREIPGGEQPVVPSPDGRG